MQNTSHFEMKVQRASKQSQQILFRFSYMHCNSVQSSTWPGQLLLTALQKSNPRYTHPIAVKENRKGYTLTNTECIRTLCAKQLGRNVSNPNLHNGIPKPIKTCTKCNIKSCEHPVYSKTAAHAQAPGDAQLHIRGL